MKSAGASSTWMLIAIANEYGTDVTKSAEHLRWAPERVQAGFNYYATFRDEIDPVLQENEAYAFEQVGRRLRSVEPKVQVESVLEWQNGRYMGMPDAVIIAVARRDGRTLVTYDQVTMVLLLVALAERGDHHGGVVLVSHWTIRQNDVGRWRVRWRRYGERSDVTSGQTDACMRIRRL
jgi:hypothetical protein